MDKTQRCSFEMSIVSEDKEMIDAHYLLRVDASSGKEALIKAAEAMLWPFELGSRKVKGTETIEKCLIEAYRCTKCGHVYHELDINRYCHSGDCYYCKMDERNQWQIERVNRPQ